MKILFAARMARYDLHVQHNLLLAGSLNGLKTVTLVCIGSSLT